MSERRDKDGPEPGEGPSSRAETPPPPAAAPEAPATGAAEPAFRGESGALLPDADIRATAPDQPGFKYVVMPMRI